MPIEIVKFAKTDGILAKRISLSADGSIKSDGSACRMSRGRAERVTLPDLAAFARMIGALDRNEAIALGALRPKLPDLVEVVTKDTLTKLNGYAVDTIARTADHIAYVSGAPALALVDIDTKAMPDDVKERIKQAGGFWQALCRVLPEIAGAARVARRSTSTGLFRTDTGERMKGSNGVHVFLAVRDGADIERFLRTFHDRCWLHGFGWLMIGKGGQLLDRSLIDRTVYAPERLVFEAAPDVEEPLRQNTALRAPEFTAGAALDTTAICPPLSVVEAAKAKELRRAAAHAMAPEAAKAKTKFIADRAEEIARRTGMAPVHAIAAAERHCGGVLTSCIDLPFDAEEFAGLTVGDVLADPDRFDGATMADPLEGVDYGIGKAKIIRRVDGWPFIHSFAHGQTVYELRYDAADIETAMRKAAPAEAAAVYVKMLVKAAIAPDDETRLAALACELADVKPRPLSLTVKAAKAAQAASEAAERRAEQAARRTDKRPQLPAPAPHAERIPVIQAIDDVLSSSEAAEPPMRDLDGHPVAIRERAPMMLHELKAAQVNEAGPAITRLPAPAMPLLATHDRFTLAHEIERHIEYVIEGRDGGVLPVALPDTFVDHYRHYQDSRVPRVGAVTPTPLVLDDGTLLAPAGLDRNRRTVFRIDPETMGAMPDPKACTSGQVAKALDFLINTWLVDVATDFPGKCVLIAATMSIIERTLLPERPAFFVTAGKRGGGKTTATAMVTLAATGKRPSAAAWSSNEEERRKAIFSYLMEGVSSVVWDNIPLGSAISCPTIEKVLTSDTYSDRVLGQSAYVTAPCFTIMLFTGNNIAPRGDTASRTLMTRLNVDRPDPENRTFTHADPIGWTIDHRGAILTALYTILLGNPQLTKAGRIAPKTRFKTWWHLVGSAIEHAAGNLTEAEKAKPADKRTACTIDFAMLFALAETHDDEAEQLCEVLAILDGRWPTVSFMSADVANLINDPSQNDVDDSVKLRTFFDPDGRRGSGKLTSIAIGHRLGAILDTPVCVNDRVMSLKVGQDTGTGKRAATYRVRAS